MGESWTYDEIQAMSTLSEKGDCKENQRGARKVGGKLRSKDIQ